MTSLNETLSALARHPSGEPYRNPPRNDEPRRWTDFANVGPTERVIVGIAGALLAARQLARRRPSYLALAGAGALILRAASGYCPAYHALGIDRARASRGPARPRDYFDTGIHVEVACTIDRPASELYAFWRDFTNLPRFMDHLESVTVLDGDEGRRRSRWVARAPAGITVEWEAEVIREEPGRLIAWRSLAGADVDNTGSVRFDQAPDGRGTEVRVTLEYIPPAGRLGQLVAGLFGKDPRTQVEQDLARLKQIMETGQAQARP